MTAEGELPLGARRTGKSEAAFRTISEVAEDLDVPQHVLRFWESKFPQVRPLKRGGGRRYYRPEDVALLRRIRDLLYSEGYTIKGVQKLLREGGHRDTVAPSLPLIEEPDLLVSVEGNLAPAAGGDAPIAREGDDDLPVGRAVDDDLPAVAQDADDDVLALNDRDVDDDDVGVAAIAVREDRPPVPEVDPAPVPQAVQIVSTAPTVAAQPAAPAVAAQTAAAAPVAAPQPPPAPPAVAAIAAAATALTSAVGPVPDTEDEDDMTEEDEAVPAPQTFSAAQRRELEALLDELEEMRALLS